MRSVGGLRSQTIPEFATENTYSLTTYPRGNQFTPISYNLGLAYIGVDTLNPEACYRWISTIAQHPELLMGMPVRRSMLDSPEIAAAQGDDVIAAYQMFDASLQDPNAIVVPGKIPVRLIPVHGLSSAGSTEYSIIMFWKTAIWKLIWLRLLMT